jgi:hypothetical protein
LLDIVHRKPDLFLFASPFNRNPSQHDKPLTNEGTQRDPTRLEAPQAYLTFNTASQHGTQIGSHRFPIISSCNTSRNANQKFVQSLFYHVPFWAIDSSTLSLHKIQHFPTVTSDDSILPTID